MRARSRFEVRSILIAAVVVACQSITLGGVSVSSSSTAKWTFDPDTAGGTASKVLSITPPISSSMPAPPSYQLAQTFTSGSSSSVAKGSIGYVANSTTATFTLAAGTGVTQSDPGDAAYPGDSMLRVDFDGIFLATSPSFGPPATGYVSIAVGGIVGVGGSTKFSGQVNFLAANNVALRPAVNFSQGYTTAGSFAQTFTSSALMNPSTIAANTTFHVKGFFEFRASNAVTPSSILPLDIDAGAAPPTATWYVDAPGSWSDRKNWTAPVGSVIENLNPNGKTNALPAIPNGVGQRARFANYLQQDRTITVDSNITLGALDISSAGNLTFAEGAKGGSIIMDVTDGNASIQARNLNGSKQNIVNTKFVLNDNLDIITDGSAPVGVSDPSVAYLSFKKVISGGNGKGVNKFGEGEASLDAVNTYSGGTNVAEGALNANVPGALGTGVVRAKGGRLNYNAAHAAKTGALVQADSGGEISLGIVPDAAEKFTIGRLGAISGNAAQLAALNTASNGNLALDLGAIIAHQTFDTGSVGGNPKNLANSAKYVFGISANFVGSEPYILSVGSASKSPWSGFGSTSGDRVFGSDPNTSNDTLHVKGSADLVSLGGTLFLNAKLNSTDDDGSLHKIGKGTVALLNKKNEFHGPIYVDEGTLRVDGTLRSLGGIDVLAGAVLGGEGTVQGHVTAENGASVNPGGNPALNRVGTLTSEGLNLSATTQLNFDLADGSANNAGLNDLLDINGDLLLDGRLNIFDAGNFGPGSYKLMDYTGNITNLGLDIGSVPNDQFGYTVVVNAGAVVLNVTAGPFVAVVPEPGSLGALTLLAPALLFRRKRRGT